MDPSILDFGSNQIFRDFGKDYPPQIFRWGMRHTHWPQAGDPEALDELRVYEMGLSENFSTPKP